MKKTNHEKLLERYKTLLECSPHFFEEYTFFYCPDETLLTQSFYKKLILIKQFLLFYIENENLQIEFKELSIPLLEKLPIHIIQNYLKKGPIQNYSLASKKLVIQTLSAFWSYFTIDSYSISAAKPIFYRHAINEWKIAYKNYYSLLLKGENATETNSIVYTSKEFEAMLLHFEHVYPLFLKTTTQLENWKRNENKYLATLAILMGTGITLEELCSLDVNQIDLRKKGITIIRKDIPTFIRISNFAIPYIKPYLTWRKNRHLNPTSERALFVNLRRNRISPGFPAEVIKKLSISYQKPITASIIRTSHGINLLEEENISIKKLQEIKGYSSLARMNRYLKTSKT